MRFKAVFIAVVVLVLPLSVFSDEVTFNDSNLLEAVRTQYEAQVGVPLSIPPTSEELSNPQFIVLDASSLNIQDLTGLEACTSLQVLNLIGNQITDVSPLGNTTYGGLTNLQYLMLGKNQITNISPLATLSGNLLYLDIGYNQISDISVLSSFSNLVGLNLGFGVFGLYDEIGFFDTGVNNLDDSDLNVLINLTNLQVLSIGGLENVTSISFLSSLPNLTQLYLGSNPITDWTPLGSVDQNLNIFVESNCGLTQSALNNYVANMTNIKYVDDDNPGILAIIEVGTGTDINDISSLSGLNPSIAILIGLGIDDIDVVSNWTSLSVFVCAVTGIQNLDALIGLPNLSSVSVPMNSIGPTMFTQPLSNNPFTNLKDITLNENILESLNGIEYMPDLEIFKADSNQINNIWAMDLEGAPKNTLMTLSLANNQIVEINPLKNYTALNEVNLSYNQIENFGYLVDNDGIGPGDYVDISYNPVPTQYCGLVDLLASKVLPGGSLNRAGVCEASVEVEIVGEGLTNPSPGITPVPYNSSLAIRAYPQNGSNYAFKQWEIYDADLGSYVLLTENSSHWFFNITDNIKVRAVFVDSESTYSITFTLIGNGVIDEFPSGSGVYRYIAGRQVNLFALTGPGAYFAGWTGDVESLGTQLYANIVMDGDKTVGAVFEETGYTLTTTFIPEGAGGVYPFPGVYYYASNVQVNLIAWANPGYKFDHWENEVGGWLGTVPSINITMDSNKYYKAVFIPITTYTLTINVEPPEAGTTNPNPGLHVYNENEIVTIFATANPGWFFSEWTGDIGNAYPYNDFIQIPMDGNKVITANFVPADLVLELYIEGADKGEISPAPGTYSYKAGQWVFLNATNYSPYAFLGWYDYDTNELISVNNFYSFQVESNMGTKRIVGKFGEAQYLVTLLEVEGSGTTTPASPGTYGYIDGQWCVLFAHPENGWRFKHWVDENYNIVTNLNPYPLEFNPEVTNYTLRAIFEECDWSVNIAKAGTGNGTTSPGVGPSCYKDGEQLYIEATPDVNSYFGGWEIIKNPSQAPQETWVYWFNTTLTIDADYDLVAWFDSSGYTLQLQQGVNGFIIPSPGVYRLAEGFPVELYAVADPGYAFLGWYDQNDELVSMENPYQFILNSDTNLIAKFGKIAIYTLRVTVQSGQGTTVPVPDIDHQYEGGTIVNLTAIPDEGWRFVRWTGDLEGVPDPNQPVIQVLMNMNRNIGVEFEQIPEGEGIPEGTVEGEGATEGIVEGEGEGSVPPRHSADTNDDGKINLSELLRVVQFFNMGGYHCALPGEQSEDGYIPGYEGDRTCTPHASDYNPQDWMISLSELLRLVQFFNMGGYYPCEGSEDGYCPGQP